MRSGDRSACGTAPIDGFRTHRLVTSIPLFSIDDPGIALAVVCRRIRAHLFGISAEWVVRTAIEDMRPLGV